jgi:hypothetical protein
VLLTALVLGWTSLLPVAVLLLGGLYAAQLRIDGGSLDGSAAAVAAGLLVTAELGYWSLEARDQIEEDRGMAMRRLAVVAVLGVGALVVSEGVLVLADLVRGRGLALDLVGAAAAAGTLVVVALLTTRTRGRE